MASFIAASEFKKQKNHQIAILIEKRSLFGGSVKFVFADFWFLCSNVENRIPIRVQENDSPIGEEGEFFIRVEPDD